MILRSPELRWDAYDAYLFDIDGTLLRAEGGVHSDAFAESVRDVMQESINLDHVTQHGNTDSRILAQAFDHAGIPRERWEEHRETIHKRMCAIVQEKRDRMQIRIMPGVIKTLDLLRSRGKMLGTATGNLESIGWLKIEMAGLREYFAFGAFSDRHEERADMIAAGAAVARSLAGEDASVCVVGDTPSDIAAGHANSLPVIAVATGVYSLEQLAAEKPEIAVTTLAHLLGTL